MTNTPLSQLTFKYPLNTGDDPTLRNSVTNIVNSFGCMTDYNAMKIFFATPSNIVGIKSAIDKYGLPPANRDSYHTGAGFLGRWHDYCDWDKGMAKFYYYAKLSMQYPVLAQAQTNCDAINGYLIALEQEKKSADEDNISTPHEDVHTPKIQAISDKISEYNSIYASISCDQYLSDVAQKKISDAQAAALAASTASELSVYTQTSGTSGGGTQLAIYAAVGVAIVIAVLAYKKMN